MYLGASLGEMDGGLLLSILCTSNRTRDGLLATRGDNLEIDSKEDLFRHEPDSHVVAKRLLASKIDYADPGAERGCWQVR